MERTLSKPAVDYIMSILDHGQRHSRLLVCVMLSYRDRQLNESEIYTFIEELDQFMTLAKNIADPVISCLIRTTPESHDDI